MHSSKCLHNLRRIFRARRIMINSNGHKRFCVCSVFILIFFRGKVTMLSLTAALYPVTAISKAGTDTCLVKQNLEKNSIYISG